MVACSSHAGVTRISRRIAPLGLRRARRGSHSGTIPQVQGSASAVSSRQGEFAGVVGEVNDERGLAAAAAFALAGLLLVAVSVPPGPAMQATQRNQGRS